MATYRRCPAATWRRLRAAVVLAVPGSSEVLQLNATGAMVWDLLEEPMEAATLTSRLAAGVSRPEADVGPVVAELLDELLASGAVVQR